VTTYTLKQIYLESRTDGLILLKYISRTGGGEHIDEAV